LIIYYGQIEIVKLLVERGDVEVDTKDDYSQTPLSIAAAKGHKDVVKLLESCLKE
jgi:ankyrin repeat protein